MFQVCSRQFWKKQTKKKKKKKKKKKQQQQKNKTKNNNNPHPPPKKKKKKKKKNRFTIENVQKRATKLVKSASHLPYNERLYVLPSLEWRRKRADVIQVYKIIHGINQ